MIQIMDIFTILFSTGLYWYLSDYIEMKVVEKWVKS